MLHREERYVSHALWRKEGVLGGERGIFFKKPIVLKCRYNIVSMVCAPGGDLSALSMYQQTNW